jgi:peptide/nickel transport system substrate-binding protein
LSLVETTPSSNPKARELTVKPAKPTRIGAFAALTTSAALLFGACGTGNTGGTATPTGAATANGGGSGGGTTANNQAGDGTACPANTPINVGFGGPTTTNVQTDNPFMVAAGTGNTYNRLMFEPLAVVNRLDPTDIRMWLASDIQWNDDYTQVVITARDGVTWSDGTPFTADDIAATFETLRDTDLDGVQVLDPTGSLGDITVSGNTVTISFINPDGTPRQRLTDFAVVLGQRILQRAYLATISDVMTDPMNGAPITGPYEVENFTTGNVILRLRDGYWGGNGLNPQGPAAERVNYIFYSSPLSLENALISGEATWSQSPLPNMDQFVAADPAHHVWWTPSDLGIEMMYLNTQEAPFSDPVFRRAANMAINRQAWRAIQSWHATEFDGQADVITSATGLLAAGNQFKDPTLADAALTFDAEGARELLREAGYQNVGVEGGLQYPDGTPVHLVIYAPSEWPDYVTSASMVAQSLRTVLGADAEMVSTDLSTWSTDRAFGRNFDAAQRAAGTTGVGPFWLYRDMIAQPGMAGFAPMGERGDWNLGRFVNEQAGEGFRAMMTSPDPAARELGLHQIQQAMVAESPVLLLGGRPIFSAYNTTCFVNWPSDDNPYAAAQFIDPGSALMILSSLERR